MHHLVSLIKIICRYDLIIICGSLRCAVFISPFFDAPISVETPITSIFMQVCTLEDGQEEKVWAAVQVMQHQLIQSQ